jgi:predicted Zn-dependent protease
MKHPTGSDVPRSLFTSADEPERHMSRASCEALYRRIVALAKGGGEVSVTIDSTWRGSLRWASNRIVSSGDSRDQHVIITRVVRGARGSAATNRVDDAGIRAALAIAERNLMLFAENLDEGRLPGPLAHATPEIFFRSSYDLDAAARSAVGRTLVEPVVAKDLLASGYIETSAQSRAVMNTSGKDAYHAITNAQYSVTVRNREGTGSGWAGVDAHDWARIDTAAVSQRALKKCEDSASPKAIEPGRYTVILEPQAVHDLMQPAIRALDRYSAENMLTVYTRSPGLSKIGMQLLDSRVTIGTDPGDPELSYLPFDYSGDPYQQSTWFKDGVLTALAYDRRYAISQLGEAAPRPNPISYRMSGGDTTLGQMIAGTARGLLVTRLSDVRVIDPVSLLCSGTTRDGLWLIENGEISHAIKNFRFNESPMFVFNAIDEIGRPQRVFGDRWPAIVPPVKARDFNFTSLADAV